MHFAITPSPNVASNYLYSSYEHNPKIHSKGQMNYLDQLIEVKETKLKHLPGMEELLEKVKTSKTVPTTKKKTQIPGTFIMSMLLPDDDFPSKERVYLSFTITPLKKPLKNSLYAATQPMDIFLATKIY